MKRSLTPFIALVAAGVLAVAAQAAGTTSVKLAHTGIGKILVNSRGYTVYAFSKYRHNQDMCVKRSGCTMTWPPLTTKGKLLPVAG